MKVEEFEEKIKGYATLIDIELQEEQIEKMYLFMNEMIEWNKNVNLTAIVEPEEIIVKHFIDSLTIAKNIKTNATVIDVGTGAGFPGIPLKIVREDLKIVLLDSLNKRVTFLNHIIDTLELKKIEAVHARVEEYAKNKKYRESFDIATSRAVANLSTLSEYLLPMIKVGGSAICMKGSEIEGEMEQGKHAIEVLGGKIIEVERFCLPKTDMKRNNIIIEKVKNTPENYPRKAGTPSKEPII